VDRDGDGRILRLPAVPQVRHEPPFRIYFLTLLGRCSRSSFFDREEFNETRNVTCPVAGCNHVWCKECQQEITPDGPEHSCDGTSEMAHLVQQEGWKYCPSKFIPCSRHQRPEVTSAQRATHLARRFLGVTSYP
jgi:hypothetical protein